MFNDELTRKIRIQTIKNRIQARINIFLTIRIHFLEMNFHALLTKRTKKNALQEYVLLWFTIIRQFSIHFSFFKRTKFFLPIIYKTDLFYD